MSGQRCGNTKKERQGYDMKYEFEGTVEFRENENAISVPFNVWEVCEKVGDAPVRVCFDDVCFICDLLPKGQGYYEMSWEESVTALTAWSIRSAKWTVWSL